MSAKRARKTAEPIESGPRLPLRLEWVELPPPYEGLSVLANVAPSTALARQVRDDFASGDAERVGAALQTLIREHNGWRDQDGTPLPPADNEGFWHHEALSTELVLVVVSTVRGEWEQLPKSLRPTRAS